MHGPLLAVLLAATSGVPGDLAVCPLVSRGVAPEAMQQLQAAVLIELARAGIVVADAKLPCLDEAQRSCGEDARCLRRFGRLAGAREVLFGEVHGHTDSYAVTLRLLDVEKGIETGSATASVNRDVEEMVWATRAQIRRLKTPDRWKGRLAFDLPRGARILVAGRPHEASRDLTLAPGPYAIRVASSGREVEAWVEVKFEQTATVSLSPEDGIPSASYSPWPVDAPAAAIVLPQDGAAPALESGQMPRWPAYAALGAGLALVAGGFLQHARANSMRGDLASMRLPNGGIPEHRLSEARALETSASAAAVSGSALLAAGAVTGLAAGAYLVFAPSPRGASTQVGVTTDF